MKFGSAASAFTVDSALKITVTLSAMYSLRVRPSRVLLSAGSA